MWIPLLPLGLVLIVVDNERFESPAPWMVHFRALSYRQRQTEFESQARTESFGICFLQSPRPEKSFQPLAFWYLAIKACQPVARYCQCQEILHKGSLLNRTPTLSTKNLNDPRLGTLFEFRYIDSYAESSWSVQVVIVCNIARNGFDGCLTCGIIRTHQRWEYF